MRIISKAATALTLSFMLLGGCVTATPYQASGYRGGYSELRVSERMFEVSFAGNSMTNANYVRSGALRRAAELTIANGFSAFAVVRDQGNTKYASHNGSLHAKPSAALTVHMVTEEERKAAPIGAEVYDARMMLSQYASR